MPAILIVAEYGSLNGGERSLLAVIPHLQRLGCRFVALLPVPSPFASELTALDVPVRSFHFRDEHGTRKELTILRQQLLDAIRCTGVDVVHLNSLAASRVAAPLTAPLNLPLIGHIRDMLKLSRQAIDDLNQLTRVIAVSQATRRWHESQGIRRPQTRVIYNGVDSDRFAPRPATGVLHRELGIPSQSKILLSVGQIGMRKGLDVTLQAAQRLVPQHSDLHFVFVGTRFSEKAEALEYEQMLYRQSAKPGLKRQVHWLGQRRDVAALMAEARLLIHAARQEPLGRVLLESFASGLPAVATDVGGTREIFCDETLSDWLVPPDDPCQLANTIIEAVRSPRRAEVSQRIRQIAIERFSAAASAAALKQAYDDVLP